MNGPGDSGTNYQTSTTQHKIDDQGKRSKTTTLSGPAGAQEAELKTSAHAERSDLERTHEFAKTEAEEVQFDFFQDSVTDSGTHTTADSHYAAKHRVGSDGQAVGGRFSADSKEVSERGTQTKLVGHERHVVNTTTYGYDEESNTEDTTKTTTTSRESGSYQDERQTITWGWRRELFMRWHTTNCALSELGLRMLRVYCSMTLMTDFQVQYAMIAIDP